LPWEYAVFPGKDFFSVEIAAPFAILHLKRGVKRTWGVNFCRARMIGSQEPSDMYSSWQGVRAAFNRAVEFGNLVIEADFSAFAFDVETAEFTVPGAPWTFSVRNRTGRRQDVRLDVNLVPQTGIGRDISATFSIESDADVGIPFGRFGKADEGALIKIALTDRQSGRRLFLGSVQSKDETPVIGNGRKSGTQ